MDWRGHKKYKKRTSSNSTPFHKKPEHTDFLFSMRRLTPAESLARRGKRRAIEDKTPEPPKSSPNVMFTWAGLKNGNEVGFAVNACTKESNRGPESFAVVSPTNSIGVSQEAKSLGDHDDVAHPLEQRFSAASAA